MIRVTYGSMRHKSPGAEGLVRTNLYWSPTLGPATSTDQNPFPSEASGLAVEDQPLKLPATTTELAKGAQTRNVTPVPAPSLYGLAPMKARLDGTTVGCGFD